MGESKPRSPGHSCITGEHNNIIQEDGLKVKTNITMGTLGIVLGITIFFGVVFLLLFQISKKKR